MVAIKMLLPDWRNLADELAEDLRACSAGAAAIDAGWKGAFRQIEQGGHTAQVLEVWRGDDLDQVAVAWVFARVFVRFIEDNGLVDEYWLPGAGERRCLVEDNHELFCRPRPHDADHEHLQHVFPQVGQIPAARDVLAKGKMPLWAVAPAATPQCA